MHESLKTLLVREAIDHLFRMGRHEKMFHELYGPDSKTHGWYAMFKPTMAMGTWLRMTGAWYTLWGEFLQGHCLGRGARPTPLHHTSKHMADAYAHVHKLLESADEKIKERINANEETR